MITVPYAVSTVVVSGLATPNITASRRAGWSKVSSRLTSLGHNYRALVCFRGLVGSGGCLTHLTLRNQMKIRESVGYFCNLKSIMYISIYDYINFLFES